MTPTDITVTGEDFVSVNEVTGVPVGTALELQTKCASAVIVQRKEGKPSATDDNGRVMKSVKNASSIYQVREGSEEVWLRLNTDNFESEGKVGVYPAVEDVAYVARLDGTQHYEFSESRILTDNFEVSFDVLIDGEPPFVLLGGDSTSGFVFFNVGKFQFRDVNGVTRETQSVFSSMGDTVYSLRAVVADGVLSAFINEVQEPLSGDTSNFTGLFFKYLATRREGDFKLNGYIKNFKLTESGATTVEIPLTNKDQGATQLPTVGDVSATMIGYTGDEWEEV